MKNEKNPFNPKTYEKNHVTVVLKNKNKIELTNNHNHNMNITKNKNYEDTSKERKSQVMISKDFKKGNNTNNRNEFLGKKRKSS